ncbi:Outer membrane vitamin B12 receptor BtuB [Chitinispirillum alkaliphilum]|nr:Outer membrane vitamin B12 receptor BtuB [Chitinispirillum alkaliphilum]
MSKIYFGSLRGTFISFILLFSALVQGNSADPSDSTDIVKLEEIVVTATRNERKVSELPVSVSVISREEIASSTAHNIDDLLSGSSGVQVRRNVGMGEGIPSDIMMRGIPGALAATRVLVLVDGIPTNAAGTPFLILNVIPLEAVERIEIVRGPYSSLYGANAFGGVINVITRNPKSAVELEARTETSLPFTALYNRTNGYRGSEFLNSSFKKAYYNNSFLFGAQRERFNLLLSGGVRSIGNYLMRDSAFVRSGENTFYKEGDNHEYRDVRLMSRGGFFINEDVDLTVHARFFASELGFGLTRGIPGYEVTTKGQMFLLGPQLRVMLGEQSEIGLGGFFRVVDGTFYGETPYAASHRPTFWNSRSGDWQIEGNYIYRSSLAGTWTAGFDYLFNNISFGATLDSRTKDTISGSYGVDEFISAGGIYLQNEFRLPWRVELTSGIRSDFNSVSSGSISPKFGFAWRAHDKLILRTSAGTAFRAPATSELFMPDMQLNNIILLRSNPNLEPERIRSVDGGIEFRPTESFRFVCDIYYNSMKDLITQRLFIDDVVGVTHRNVNRAVSRGAELEIDWEPAHWIRLNANYNHQNTKNRDELTALDYIPDHNGAVRAQLKSDFGRYTFQGTLAKVFVGKRGFMDLENSRFQELDPYIRTDLTLRLDFENTYWAVLSAQNLFDAEIEESPGTLTPGRFFSLELGTRIW